MQDFERLGYFFLGRTTDPQSPAEPPQLALYDSRDLLTHALCVGMTGSGKTGLGIGLIEEAAIDGVPVIAIDPKGDLSNLLLTFPELSGAQFEPWVNAEDAARAGLDVAQFATEQAQRWRDGLADWGQDGARIQRLRDAAEFTIFTPGSTAGVPVSVLGSFEPPAVASDEELLVEQAHSTVSGLLALVESADAGPTSAEHILLSTLLLGAWRAGEVLDLAELIRRVQDPPLTHIGVLELEDAAPRKKRLALALALNSLLAAPGYNVWTQGAALDVGSFLRRDDGHPRVSIFSIAHLDDAQRMFFVTRLLSAVVAWMRSQTGTGSLRAIIYMDEIFGFFPPVANPPSKLPLLTLLKQARAYGVGIVLCTQNPADLDYKGLGNIGTWLLGRLQTQRDKERVLDGLEGVGAGALDRGQVDALLSNLPKRTFLLRNVHDPELALLETRWAMSYLRGPLDREGIRRLMAGTEHASPAAVSLELKPITSADADTSMTPASPTAPSTASAVSVGNSPLPPEVPQFFAPAPKGSALEPVLYAAVELRYSNARLGLDHSRELLLQTPITDAAITVDWAQAQRSSLVPDQLIAEPPDSAEYRPVPKSAAKASSYTAWARQLKSWVAENQTLELQRCGKLLSRPGEPPRDFLARVAHEEREQRDAAIGKLRDKYSTKRATLEGKVQRAEQTLARESAEAASQRMDTALSVGATLAGALLGRRTRRRISTAARSANRAAKQGQDVARAREALNGALAALSALDAQFDAEVLKVQAGNSRMPREVETIAVKPKRDAIEVKLLALVWTPVR